jgi:hypothetical protein
MRAVLQAQINKTDRNDARGIAQMMRAGLYRPVHVKTLRSQKLRMLLTHRKPSPSITTCAGPCVTSDHFRTTPDFTLGPLPDSCTAGLRIGKPSVMSSVKPSAMT